MRPELRLPPRDHARERVLACELEALEELLVTDHAAALERLDVLAERTGHPCDETLVWAYASNGEETLLGLALPPPPRLRDLLTHEEQLELVRAWWACAREAFDPYAETWFWRVLEANLVDPSSVPDAASPEDLLARALAKPQPVGMPAPDPLGVVLGSWLAADLPVDTLLTHVEAAGVPLAALLDALTCFDAPVSDEVEATRERLEDEWPNEVDRFEALAFFADRLGVERTRAICDQSERWRGLDVVGWLAHLETQARAIEEAWAAKDMTLELAYEKARACDPAHRGPLLRVFAGRAFEELVALAPKLQDDDAATIRAALVEGARGADRDALVVEALEATWNTTAPAELLSAVVRLLALVPSDGEPARVLFRAWLDASARASCSLSSATTFAARHLTIDDWLAALRSRGLRASTAALHILEGGASVLETTRLLLGVGYDDEEVYAALRSNGVASVATLTVLRESGWEPSRMVDVLSDRGVLPTEARDHLRALGLDADALRSLLGARWDAATVALVLEG